MASAAAQRISYWKGLVACYEQIASNEAWEEPIRAYALAKAEEIKAEIVRFEAEIEICSVEPGMK